jgi:hypothetical protein
MRRFCCLFAMLAFTLLCGEARAWGDLGHKVICEIAFRSVQPDTRGAINRLMQLDSEYNTFSDSCIYPDHPRIRAAEHFLNLPRDSKGLTSDECPLANACVLTAILRDVTILRAKEQDDASKLVALRSLLQSERGFLVGGCKRGQSRSPNSLRSPRSCRQRSRFRCGGAISY